MYDVSRDVDELLNEPFPANKNVTDEIADEYISDHEENIPDENNALPQPESSKSPFTKVLNFVKKFINIIAFIVAGFFAIIMLLVIFGDDLFAYYYSLNLNSPKARFTYAETRSAEQFADSVSALYSKWYNRICMDTSAYEAEIHLLLSDEVSNQINNYLPEENRTDLSWIDDLSVSVNINRDRYLYQITTSSQLQKDTIFSVNSMVDMSQLLLMLQLPDLSDSYLTFDLNEYYEELYSRSISQYAVDKDSYTQLMAALPSEQVLNQLLLKYYTLLINQIDDVKQQQTLLTTDTISVDCTALTATISEKQLIEMYINLLETVRDDSLIIGMVENISDAYGLDPQDERERFLHTVTGYIGELHVAAGKANPKNNLQWIIYVDGNNNILGRRVIVSGVESEFFTYSILDGGDFAYYFNLFDTVCVKGQGSRFETVMDAEFDVYLDGVDVCSITVDDLHFVQYLKGNLSGKMRFQPTDHLVKQWYGQEYASDLAFMVDLETTKRETDIHIDIEKDGLVIAGFTFYGKDKAGKDFDFPDLAVETNDKAAWIQWLENLDFNKLKSNLRQANIPPELTNIFEEYLDELLESLQG